MRSVAVVPLVGIIVAVSVPLLRHVEKRRHENTALEGLQQVRAAQDAFKARASGYAIDLTSLITACGRGKPMLAGDVLTDLEDAGYRLQLRAAAGAALTGRDCHGRPLVDDYYVATAPVDASEAAQQAFAARAGGSVYLFLDGIAPREVEMLSGLATPVELRDTFRIP